MQWHKIEFSKIGQDKVQWTNTLQKGNQAIPEGGIIVHDAVKFCIWGN